MFEQQETSQDVELNLLELIRVVLKRKKLVAIMTVSFALISVIYALMLTNIYSATSKILPPQKEGGGGLSALLGQAGGLAGLATGATGLTGTGDLYLGILKSRSVGDSVIKRLNLMQLYKLNSLEDTRRVLERKVKFQAAKDGIITITADDKDPRQAALLANTFVDELGKTMVRLNLTKAGTERMFLEKRLELVKKDLKTAEDALKEFAQNNKIVQVDAQAKASVEGIAKMKAELASREVQLSVLRSKQTEQSPEVKAMETGVQRLRGEISRLSAGDGKSDAIPSVGSVPTVGLEYSRKLRELKTQEAIFEQLTKQYEVAKLSEAKDSSSFQVLDEAVVPINKSKPHRSNIVILTTIAAFFVSVFFVFLLEYLEKMPEEDKTIFREIKRLALTFR